jgi:hypothetical protein
LILQRKKDQCIAPAQQGNKIEYGRTARPGETLKQAKGVIGSEKDKGWRGGGGGGQKEKVCRVVRRRRKGVCARAV